MTRFVPGPGLDQRVAARWGVPAARDLAEALANRVKANAPAAKTWVTKQDERVRKTHNKADGQTIPDNLRYILDHPSRADTDASNGQNGFEAGAQELAEKPRDPQLSIGNRINCRCISVEVPGLIAEHVSTSSAVAHSSSAVAKVSVDFTRIVESEHPGPNDGGGGWLRRSIEETSLAHTRQR